MKCSVTLLLGFLPLASCGIGARAAADRAAMDSLPLVRDTLRPAVVTERLPVDSDDPAIWIDERDPARSLVVGTDKGDTNGGVYVFTLDGRIDHARSVTPLMRMNNVDAATGVPFGGRTIDIAAATERGRQMLRIFELPSMRVIDGGGIPVMNGDATRAPMGIALYKRPRDGRVFAFVGGKSGPRDHYLAQYELREANGVMTGTMVREFGAWSGKKEIEAIAVDDRLGYVYYSDEMFGVRKYHADPDSGSTELGVFATRGVVSDHEGLAIYQRDDSTGYILLSDQQGGRLHVFPREGTPANRHDHPLLAVIPVLARETDGVEVTARALGPAFPHGMLVMMSSQEGFHFYRWDDVQRAIDSVQPAKP